MLNIIECGEGIKVKLIGAMPRESFTDIAAAFTRSEKSMEEIVSMPYNEGLVERIINMNHLAATEFDYFVFAVEGASRVTEVQLVRKRLASYLFKSGRVQKGGKRSFDIIRPKSLKSFYATVNLNPSRILVNDSENLGRMVGWDALCQIDLDYEGLMDIIKQYYDAGVKAGLPEEDLRYAKPQGTEFKGLIAMNAHGLLDWFKIRICHNAQFEIKELARKMLKECKDHSPALFKDAGASCKVLGYCPENAYQCEQCKGKILTHDEVKVLIKKEQISRRG